MTGLNLTPWRKGRRSPATSASLFDNLHDEVDRLFEEFAGNSIWPRQSTRLLDRDIAPAVDVSETEKFVEVSADLPGIDEKDVDVTLSDNVLTIRAKRESEVEDKKKDFHRIERTYGSYFRQIPMPCEVQEDDVQASFKKGVLTVMLPKAPEARSSQKKIEVTTS